MSGTKLTFEVLSIDPDTTPHTPHLILPMEVDGEMLCPLYHGGRMTTARVTDIHGGSANTASITDPGSPWTGIERPGTDESEGDGGEFTFAVPCGGTLNCKWVYSDEAGAATGPYPAGAGGMVYVNGVYVTSFGTGPVYPDEVTHAAEEEFTISLTCRPCGNLITIHFLGDPYPG